MARFEIAMAVLAALVASASAASGTCSCTCCTGSKCKPELVGTFDVVDCIACTSVACSQHYSQCTLYDSYSVSSSCQASSGPPPPGAGDLDDAAKEATATMNAAFIAGMVMIGVMLMGMVSFLVWHYKKYGKLPDPPRWRRRGRFYELVDPDELTIDGDLHEEPVANNVPMTVSVSLSSGHHHNHHPGHHHNHHPGHPPPYAGHYHEEPPKGNHIGFSIAL